MMLLPCALLPLRCCHLQHLHHFQQQLHAGELEKGKELNLSGPPL